MKYDIWLEGYRMNGGGSQASFIDTVEAESFKEACNKSKVLAEMNYCPETLTIWGMRLFDNETDARKLCG